MKSKLKPYLKSPCLLIPNLSLVLPFINRLDELAYLFNFLVCKMRCSWQKMPPLKKNQRVGGGGGGGQGVLKRIFQFCFLHQVYTNKQLKRVDGSHVENTPIYPHRLMQGEYIKSFNQNHYNREFTKKFKNFRLRVEGVI